MTDILIRFLIGGVVVSIFAVIGDLFKPKSFAGLFGAAPSVALATILLTVRKEGADYAATEAHSMLAGAAAFFIYSSAVSWFMMHKEGKALPVSAGFLSVWAIVAFGLWFILVRHL
jgi:uncharacterized membrane protein (GlpM family)